MKRKELEAAIAAGTPLALKPSAYSLAVEPVVVQSDAEHFAGRKIGVTIVGKAVAPRRVVALSRLTTLAEAEAIIAERKREKQDARDRVIATADVAERLFDLLGRPSAVGSDGKRVTMDRETAERIVAALAAREAVALKLDALADEAARESAEQPNHGRMLYCEGQAHGMRHAARMLRGES